MAAGSGSNGSNSRDESSRNGSGSAIPSAAAVGAASSSSSSYDSPVPIFRDMHEFEVEAVAVIVEGLQEEHHFLQSMVIGPILAFVTEVRGFDGKHEITCP